MRWNNVLNLINKIYKKDIVTNDLIVSLIKKLNLTEYKINDLYKQIFLDSASWYVNIKEEEMGINKRLDDIDKRRAYIKIRLLGTGKATKEMLEETANTVPGVECEIQFEDMTVIINFLKVENNKYLGVVKRSIENMMPYHLGLEIKYDHVNWGEVKAVTWGNLKAYTWGSVSESVAGTIIKNLDDDFD